MPGFRYYYGVQLDMLGPPGPEPPPPPEPVVAYVPQRPAPSPGGSVSGGGGSGGVTWVTLPRERVPEAGEPAVMLPQKRLFSELEMAPLRVLFTAIEKPRELADPGLAGLQALFDKARDEALVSDAVAEVRANASRELLGERLRAAALRLGEAEAHEARVRALVTDHDVRSHEAAREAQAAADEAERELAHAYERMDALELAVMQERAVAFSAPPPTLAAVATRSDSWPWYAYVALGLLALGALALLLEPAPPDPPPEPEDKRRGRLGRG